MVDALSPLTDEIPELQVTGFYNPSPTPPSIDIYPADPFQEGAGYGVEDKRVWWTVRARVSTADPTAASETLLRLLDVHDPASVEVALALIADCPAVVDTLNGLVSGFTRFADDQSSDLLGCQWRVGQYL